jgi:phenylacetate-CoA ligase
MPRYSTGLMINSRIPNSFKPLMGAAGLLLPRRLTLGQGFYDDLMRLKYTERMAKEEITAVQEGLLRNIISHSYRTVPSYHGLMKSKGLTPSDIARTSDLSKLPIITKEDMRASPESYRSSESDKYSPGKAKTSGSTGKPFEFILDQRNREMEYAAVWRHLSWSGIENLDCRIASFRGDFVSGIDSGRLWRLEFSSKELVFNTYQLSQENVKSMISKINNFKPELIRGYPHSLYCVSKIAHDNGHQVRFRPITIQTSSESLTETMRETIENFFGCPVSDWYSQSEYVVSMGQCEHGKYHLTDEKGILTTIEDPWGNEKIIGTSLYNYSMPFINYEIGDLVSMDGGQCDCGRKLTPINSVLGRINDIILTPDGRAISGVGMDHYIKHEITFKMSTFPDYLKINQFDQWNYSIELFYSRDHHDEDVDTFVSGLRKLLGDDVNIKAVMLSKMPETNKWKIIESRMTL